MANMSTASGSVTLVTDTKEHAREIFKALNKHLNKGDYYTEFFDDELKVVQESDTACTVECDFEASGRWSYETNIENLGYWCEQDPLLTELPWKLKFDFVDEEGGCDFLYHAVKELTHEASEKLEDIACEDVDYTDYSRNVFSLNKIMGYDKEYLSETFQLGKNYLSEFSDPEEYEDNREECLDSAASSYIDLADSSATFDEAKEKITQLFDPLFNPVDGELA